jgi:hypothetical protein
MGSTSERLSFSILDSFMRSIKRIAMLSLSAALPAGAVEVILDYEAEARTVVGTPFGLSIPRLTLVTGSFTYDTDTKGGLMQFDGIGDGNYFLTFAMTDDTGAAHPDDALPEQFPMTGVRRPIGRPFPTYPYPHTFVIGDGLGTNGTGQMLLQLNWLSQRGETPRITAASFEGSHFTIVFTSQDTRNYTIEFSTDLVSWDPIATDVPATGASTSFRDTDAATRLGAIPDTAYYRVRRN